MWLNSSCWRHLNHLTCIAGTLTWVNPLYICNGHCHEQGTGGGNLSVEGVAGTDEWGGCRGCAPPSPAPEMSGQLSNTTGILQKRKLCATPPKKNHGSAPGWDLYRRCEMREQEV